MLCRLWVEEAVFEDEVGEKDGNLSENEAFGFGGHWFQGEDLVVHWCAILECQHGIVT